jgi:hypothetical protein
VIVRNMSTSSSTKPRTRTAAGAAASPIIVNIDISRELKIVGSILRVIVNRGNSTLLVSTKAGPSTSIYMPVTGMREKDEANFLNRARDKGWQLSTATAVLEQLKERKAFASAAREKKQTA